MALIITKGNINRQITQNTHTLEALDETNTHEHFFFNLLYLYKSTNTDTPAASRCLLSNQPSWAQDFF